jgi:hypothetical protein
MKNLAICLILMFALGGCAFLTSAVGSLAGNIGADIAKDKEWFVTKDKEEENKEKEDGGK